MVVVLVASLVSGGANASRERRQLGTCKSPNCGSGTVDNGDSHPPKNGSVKSQCLTCGAASEAKDNSASLKVTITTEGRNNSAYTDQGYNGVWPGSQGKNKTSTLLLEVLTTKKKTDTSTNLGYNGVWRGSGTQDNTATSLGKNTGSYSLLYGSSNSASTVSDVQGNEWPQNTSITAVTGFEGRKGGLLTPCDENDPACTPCLSCFGRKIKSSATL